MPLQDNLSCHVNLDVHADTNATDGWMRAKNENGTGFVNYCYKYIGGHSPGGHVQHKVNHGEATVTVQLRADGRFQLLDISFQGDEHGQLSHANTSTANERQMTITNACTHEMDAHYGVKVRDTGNHDAILVCDPSIRNLPE